MRLSVSYVKLCFALITSIGVGLSAMAADLPVQPLAPPDLSEPAQDPLSEADITGDALTKFLTQLEQEKRAVEEATRGDVTPLSGDRLRDLCLRWRNYCQRVLRLRRTSMETAAKVRQAAAAAELGEVCAKRAPGQLITTDVAALRYLERLLRSPSQEAGRRLSNARMLCQQRDYRTAEAELSSFVGVPEAGEERDSRMLRGFCRARLSRFRDAVSDLRQVVGDLRDDEEARKSLYAIILLEVMCRSYNEAILDAEALIAHYAPSPEAGKTQQLLITLRKLTSFEEKEGK
jgi:hypothetical protein